MKKEKVLIITNIISPYRIPLFNSINELGDFDFKVIALAEREKNREWLFEKNKIRFPFKVLSGKQIFFTNSKREISFHFSVGILRDIIKEKPNVIITTGYDTLAYWMSFFYCKFFRKKYILWNGTTLMSAASLRGIRGFFKRIIIRGSDRCIAYGTKAKEYLIHFGAEPKNIFISLNTVDIEFFNKKTFELLSSNDFLEKRKKYPQVLMLYIGQLTKRKGVIQVLKALKNLNDSSIGFLIVGSGPEKDKLKEYCDKNKIKNVFFEGFRQQEELPKYYALADILILPSFEEVWGLVVNEALAGGVHVLCSKYAGVAYDLINNNNGNIFDPKNIKEMENMIKEVRDRTDLIRLKRKEVSSWAKREMDIRDSAKSIVSAIESL